MKSLLSFLFFGLISFAQTTFPIQIAAEAPVSVTLSAQAVTSAVSMILGTVAPLTSPTTLTAAVTAAQTTLPMASVLGVTTGMGALCGSELSLITGISVNTLTVTRATIGTTAAIHASGSTCTFTASGDSSVFVANLLALAVQNAMIVFPASTIATQNTAIATATATIQSTVAAGVSHVP